MWLTRLVCLNNRETSRIPADTIVGESIETWIVKGRAIIGKWALESTLLLDDRHHKLNQLTDL